MSTTVNFIDPQGKTFEYWSSLMAEQLAALGIVRGGTEAQWQDWARRMVADTAISAQGVPLPDQYKKWQDWATQLLNYSVTF